MTTEEGVQNALDDGASPMSLKNARALKDEVHPDIYAPGPCRFGVWGGSREYYVIFLPTKTVVLNKEHGLKLLEDYDE